MVKNESIRQLTKELQYKAIKELNEDPRRVLEYLELIQKWLMKQPHLRVKMKDQQIISFLRGTKWSINLTKQKIDNFYTLRNSIPSFFNRDPLCEDIQSLLKSGALVVLPSKKGSVEPTVFFVTFTDVALKVPFTTSVKICLMVMDILMIEDDNIVISGFKIVVDYKNITAAYILQMTPTLVKDIVICLQNIYPMRMKEFIGLNVPKAIEIGYNTFAKPFLSEKLKQRVHFTSQNTWRSNDEVDVNVAHPPVNFDNDVPFKVLSDQLCKKLESYRNWFLESNDYFCDETLRPRKLSTELGIEGTFRQLNID